MTLSQRQARTVFIAILMIAVGAMFWIFLHSPLLLDENLHSRQIMMLMRHDTKEQLVTMPTTYHHLILALANLPGRYDAVGLRSANFFYSLLFIACVWWATRVLHPERQYLKTLQIVFLPMVFVLLPLLYTDIFAASFTVLAYGFYFRGRLLMTGLLCCLALAVRQTNIAWLLMFYIMIYVDRFGYKLSPTSLYSHVVKHWIFLAGAMIFTGFLIWNGGFAMGSHKDSHALQNIYFANVFSFVLFFMIMFLPLVLFRLPRIKKLLGTNPGWYLAALAYLAAYFLLFEITHKWNMSRAEPGLLRNYMLQFIFDHPWVYVLTGLLSAVAFLVLITETLCIRQGWFIYPASLLVFLPISLVEPRYYILSFISFILLTRPEPKALDLVLTVWLFIISALVAFGHYQMWFFL